MLWRAETVGDLLVKNKPKAAESFMDYVFAEAFDSKY